MKWMLQPTIFLFNSIKKYIFAHLLKTKTIIAGGGECEKKILKTKTFEKIPDCLFTSNHPPIYLSEIFIYLSQCKWFYSEVTKYEILFPKWVNTE